MVIFVTGGSGFIGRETIKQLLATKQHKIVNLDCLTYAGDYYAPIENNLSQSEKERYIFEKINLCELKPLQQLFEQYKPSYLIHLAAESHVDQSIESPVNFIQSNIIGTFNLLESVRQYLDKEPELRSSFRFLHVSTDEVFGELGVDDPPFTESSQIKPNSPYSASKASSDLLVDAWVRTYKLPCMMSHCSNNYGQFQHPEKLIPFMIERGIAREPMSIYGDGNQIRDWLHVSDHVNALLFILFNGDIGDHYNIGANQEFTNNEIVETICEELALFDQANGKPQFQYSDLITHITDRKGHDIRYAIDNSKILKELNWKPKVTFKQGLADTIRWYVSRQTKLAKKNSKKE